MMTRMLPSQEMRQLRTVCAISEEATSNVLRSRWDAMCEDEHALYQELSEQMTAEDASTVYAPPRTTS